jgi:hypothetical protein
MCPPPPAHRIALSVPFFFGGGDISTARSSTFQIDTKRDVEPSTTSQLRRTLPLPGLLRSMFFLSKTVAFIGFSWTDGRQEAAAHATYARSLDRPHLCQQYIQKHVCDCISIPKPDLKFSTNRIHDFPVNPSDRGESFRTYIN